MMKTMKKALSVFLVVVIMLTAAPLSGFVGLELPEWPNFSIDASAAASGTCGDNLTWAYDASNFTLIISGTGAMEDYNDFNHPWQAFENRIKKVIIGDGVTTIGDWAFHSFNNLVSITVDNNNLYYSSDEYGILFNKNKTALVQYPECNTKTHYTIPACVTSISNDAFNNCNSLVSVTIPDSVISIGDYAFSGCENLTDLTIGNGVASIGDGAFSGCESLISITIPDSVITIGDCAFGGCENLTDLTIGDSVISVGESAFADCDRLISVTTPNSVKSIGDCAFSGCESLTNATMKCGVTTIGDWAFADCTSLSSVTIPDSITSIGDRAFNDCIRLVDVYYSGTEEQWNNISIGSDSWYLTNATIHYNSNGPDNTGHTHNYVNGVCTICGLSNSDEPTNPDKPTEDNRVAYCGILEDYDETIVVIVDPNGDDEVLTEAYVSEITVDGEIYNVQDSLIPSQNFSDYLNKEVVFVVKDNEVVEMGLISVSAYIGGNDFVGYNPDKNYGFTMKTLNITLSIYNSIVSLVPYKTTTDYQANRIAFSKLDGLKIHVSTAEFNVSSSEKCNFSGESYIQIPINRYVKLGDSYQVNVNLNMNDSYTPKERDEYIDVNSTVNIVNNKGNLSLEDGYSIKIRKYPSKPSTNNSVTPDVGATMPTISNAAAKQAATELKKVQGAVSLYGSTTLNALLSKEQLDAIANRMLCLAVLSKAPKDTFSEYLSEKVINKVFSVNTNWLKITDKEIGLTVAVDTQFGEMIIEFYSAFPSYSFNGYNFGAFGQIDYEITGGKGKKKMPSNYEKSGIAGMFTYTDVDSFAQATYNLAKEELKRAYGDAYGDGFDEAVEIIFGDTVNDVLDFAGFGSASGLVWETFTIPAKKVKIECPVNVYIYDSNNNLVASIENNKETLSNENVKITINGDIKTVYLYDDSYNIAYRATANGKLKVTVSEYANDDGLLRTVVNDDIVLDVGETLQMDIDNEYLFDSDYNITSNGGTVYEPDSDVSMFHKHIAGSEWFDGNDLTCIQDGCKYAMCSVCDEWFMAITEASGHIDFDNDGDCEQCNKTLYTLTWNVDGYKTTRLLAYGDNIDYPKIPIKSGYSFVGWDSDSPDTMPENNLMLTAIFEVACIFSIQNPSRTEIRHKDGIKLHTKLEGTAPAGSYVKWTASNGKFKTEEINDGNSLKIVSDSNGKTTFTATLYSADGKVLATDTIEMKSKAGFFDKIGSFFRSIFGGTKIYEN